MVDVELGGDGADGPMLGVEETAHLGVLLGRDHGAAPGTRDGSARAVEGATRFRGHRPCNATHPPGMRSAPEPSTCRPAVCRAAREAGKCDPSRGPDTRAGDRDDRGGLRGWRDGGDGPPESSGDGPAPGTPASNTRGRDRTTGRSRRAGYNAGRFSAAAGRPRRRSGGALRLDTITKPWHKRADRLGLSEHRGGHRGSGVPAPGPHLDTPPPDSVAVIQCFGGALGGICYPAPV